MVEDFMGREVDIHRILVLLAVQRRRFVVVHGCAGEGKTALLAELGRFVKLRG